jgi:hypothetical protein
MKKRIRNLRDFQRMFPPSNIDIRNSWKHTSIEVEAVGIELCVVDHRERDAFGWLTDKAAQTCVFYQRLCHAEAVLVKAYHDEAVARGLVEERH